MADFTDGKDAGALRTIGEVSATLGIKPHVLRYWEEQFPSLRPLKRAGGRRLYRPEDVAQVRRIHALLSGRGLTLKGARAAIDRGADPRDEPPLASPQGTVPMDVLSRLKAVRNELAAALA